MTRMPTEVVEAVFKRDRDRLAAIFKVRGYATEWIVGSNANHRMRIMAPYNFVICPAVLIDPDEFGKCWGRWTIEHCGDTVGMKKGMSIAGVRKGRRAENDLAHCISLCQGHTEPGMRAGSVWNLRNRPSIRKYLATTTQ